MSKPELECVPLGALDYIAELEDALAELEAARGDVIEIYAGMEGFVPETAPEGYCLRIIEQMYNAALLEKNDD